MSSRARRALVWTVVAACLGLVPQRPRPPRSTPSETRTASSPCRTSRSGEGAQTYAVRGASSTVRATRGSGEGVRSSQWDDVIDHHAREQGLRPDLVRAVIQVESAFNPRARSHKGAMGLMQLMPATARDLGVRNAYDPLENIRGGIAYLRGLLDRFNGNEELALAAYNAGAGAVDQVRRHRPALPRDARLRHQDPGQGRHQPRGPQRDLPDHRAGRRRRSGPLLEPAAAARHDLRGRAEPPLGRVARRTTQPRHSKEPSNQAE